MGSLSGIILENVMLTIVYITKEETLAITKEITGTREAHVWFSIIVCVSE